jgi:acetolactate synthase-1/3 small subunit
MPPSQAMLNTQAPGPPDEKVKWHTISILVQNKFGAFNRIAGMFAAKGYNIDSLSVGPTEDDGVSRMTIVARGDDQIIEQITKQLNKLIDIVKVIDLTFESFVDRELVLVKVQTNDTRSEIMQIAEIFRAKVVDISPDPHAGGHREPAEGRRDYQDAEALRDQGDGAHRDGWP